MCTLRGFATAAKRSHAKIISWSPTIIKQLTTSKGQRGWEEMEHLIVRAEIHLDSNIDHKTFHNLGPRGSSEVSIV